ncbi:MAG: T9SS type A sorting domain-containing protein [Saprospiraceae bacterium]
MKSICTIICFFLFYTSTLEGQQLISATLTGTSTKQQITAIFGLPFVRNGAKHYKVRYTSLDAKGNKDTLSGLMVVPDDLSFTYPRVVYQHGTSDCKTCVPSRLGGAGGDEGQIGLLIAGLGFVSILPDYVGMGDGRGFQTYVHEKTIVSAAVDMMEACKQWASQNGLFTNEQIFITGYSQGGYGSMALHKYFETKANTIITGAAHLSGPYSLSGVMRDLILSDTEYFYPAYVPNTMLGFREAYPNVFNNFGDFFKPEYVNDIREYYEGKITLSTLNSRAIQLLKTNTGASVGGRMIKDSTFNMIKNNLNHPINQILRENDLYNWVPKAPTKIYYCKADDQVPFMNSIVARDTMTAKGATNLEVRDLNSTANHSGCVTPALTQTVFFFLGLQRVTTSVKDALVADLIKIFPNPANQRLTVSGLEGDVMIRIFNMNGMEVLNTSSNKQESIDIDVTSLTQGMHILVLDSVNKNTKIFKLSKVDF